MMLARRNLIKPMSEFSTEQTLRFPKSSAGEEGQAASFLPTIEYSDRLQESDVPYTIKVDPEKCGNFLRFLGMKPEKIEQTKIIIARKSHFPDLYGRYKRSTGNITIFADRRWGDYQAALELAEEIAEGKIKPDDDQFKGVLTTRRLSEYLTQASPERGVAFAEKLLRRSLKKRLESTVRHEMIHAADSEKELLNALDMAIKLGVSFSWVGPFLVAAILRPNKDPSIQEIAAVIGGAIFMATLANSISHKISPMERRAKRLDEMAKKDPNWHSLLTITPKEKAKT